MDFREYRAASASAIERTLTDPLSIGMANSVYGSLGMKRISTRHGPKKNIFSQQNYVFAPDLRLGSTDLSPLGKDRLENHFPRAPRLDSGPVYMHPVSSRQIVERDEIVAAQRELLKTHAEILALEDEIRRSQMTDFLSAGQRDSLLQLFGPNTDAGRQLRKLFGKNQHEAAHKVRYPPLKPQTVREAPHPPVHVAPIPVMKWRPTKTTKPPTIPVRPGRRPVRTIIEQTKIWTPEAPSKNRKDLSMEKKLLQERFQFFDPKISVPSEEDIKTVLMSGGNRSTSAQSEVSCIVEEIVAAQTEFDACQDQFSRLSLQHRIDRGIKELKLIVNSNTL